MKAKVAIFFSVLFMCLIVTPSVLLAFGDDVSKCILLDSNNEENKGSETVKILDVEIVLSQDSQFTTQYFKQNASTPFYSRTYSSYSLSLNSPPPEILS